MVRGPGHNHGGKSEQGSKEMFSLEGIMLLFLQGEKKTILRKKKKIQLLGDVVGVADSVSWSFAFGNNVPPAGRDAPVDCGALCSIPGQWKTSTTFASRASL